MLPGSTVTDIGKQNQVGTYGQVGFLRDGLWNSANVFRGGETSDIAIEITMRLSIQAKVECGREVGGLREHIFLEPGQFAASQTCEYEEIFPENMSEPSRKFRMDHGGEMLKAFILREPSREVGEIGLSAGFSQTGHVLRERDVSKKLVVDAISLGGDVAVNVAESQVGVDIQQFIFRQGSVVLSRSICVESIL